MCGILGKIAWKPSEGIQPALEAMQSAQRHRGPDRQAEWTGDGVGIGCARLSILDLSAAGDQPMLSPDGRYVLVYNGELYNFRALRSRLQAKGRAFRSGSDTEVLLAALVEDGEAVLPELDGMFAFAFLDLRERSLLLARDRSGIKPLHYYDSPEAFLFASEIKSIWAALGKSGLEPDLPGLRDAFSLGYSYGSRTPYAGLRSLEPGFALRIPLDKRRPLAPRAYHGLLDGVTRDYWNEQERREETDVLQELEGGLTRSVEAHLVSDAPLAVVASGGVDSSLIAALARPLAPNVKLYHASVAGPSSEESHARRVAAHLGLPLTIAAVDKDSFLRAWPLAVFHNDLPSYHPNDVPLYLVCRRAREDGIKVLLSGEGADELFGGYAVYEELSRRLSWSGRLGRLPRRLGRLLGPLAESLLPGRSGSNGLGAMAAMLGMTSLGRAGRILESELLFSGGCERFRRSLEIRERLAFLPPDERMLAGYLLERSFGHLGSLLHRNDRMGMMASIECRIPFLSNELLARWLGMPVRFKVAPGGHRGLKFLLKRLAARRLPEDICYRPKAGFSIPLGLYLTPDPGLFSGGFLEGIFGVPGARLGELCRDPEAYYRWASVELWGRFFFLGESPEAWSERIVAKCR